ncbi:PREDICTED: tight junction protein ZO-3-like [Nanorana parkeri]|uniref:tight junction protein ZO-3-like n=1 Tax=Nanorana parkeri TaxID=125878 RepID=UPI000854FD78|nr:PREDICTED: tight junction protein ZO-3-like [Nanorana parkeri]
MVRPRPTLSPFNILACNEFFSVHASLDHYSQSLNRSALVNETSFHNTTREDAVQYLMNIPQNEEIILLTQGKEDIYRKMIKSNLGDSFYIRTHFEYEADTPSGLSFTRGEIFHVFDTMHRGKLGNWLATRVGKDLKEMKKGIIPNKSRAEQYASLENVLKPQPSSGPRAEFWKLRGLRGAKKILKKSREDLSVITSKAKYPPYEKVALREVSACFHKYACTLVNETSFHNTTREDAVQYLMNIPQNEEIILLTQGKEDIYRKMIKSNLGDSFYIRTHFEYEADTPSGLSFTRGEIFHVFDTMHRGKLGNWLATRVGKDLKEMKKGIIPNKSRAEQYASLENVLKPQPSSGPRAEFWKLRGLRGAKKILKKSREDLSVITSKAKYPPYEKVALREASFKRPVVVLGPISDIAHMKLCSELPQEFEGAETVAREDGTSKIIKLQLVREIAERNKHALLDITPTAVEHLNYVQFYPIVVFCNPENRQGVKAMRQWLLPESKKSSRRLYAQAVKLRKNYSHLFTAVINLSGASDSWLRSLKETIRTEQGRVIWTTEDKAEPSGDEPLDLINESAVHSADYLSCDSRANSDYEETDAEGEAYTDHELEEEFQEPALARSSEPVAEYQPSLYDPSYNYRSHSPVEDASYSGPQSPDRLSPHFRSNSRSNHTYSPTQETEMQLPDNQLIHETTNSREYEHDALRRKFNHARNTSSEDEDYGWGGPATDL